jgi:hypothetical protein
MEKKEDDPMFYKNWNSNTNKCFNTCCNIPCVVYMHISCKDLMKTVFHETKNYRFL